MMHHSLWLALLASATFVMVVSPCEHAAPPSKNAHNVIVAPRPTRPPYFVPMNKTEVNWHGAMIECHKLDMVLAQVGSLRKFNIIAPWLRSEREYWLGASDLQMINPHQPGQYQWLVDGSKVNMSSLYWLEGEDEHSRNLVRPHCVYVSLENTLSLGDCASARSFLCER